MSPPADLVIRTTARIQEANEPPRQKPIIKIDPRYQQELMAHINEASQLASNIRASIDSGRDNPFRPDGEIYKLTDPIVDYYKFGPNQSRTATPTYAELDYFSSKNKRKRRAAERAARNDDRTRRSCWRRWMCCCCFNCLCPLKIKRKPPSNSSNGSALPHLSSSDKDPNGTAVSRDLTQDGEIVKIIEPSDRVATKETDLKHTPSLFVEKQFKTNVNGANKTRKTPQTKKVVLGDGLNGHESSQGQSNGKTGAFSKRGPHMSCALHSYENQTTDELKTTKVKTVRTSRCVIS